MVKKIGDRAVIVSSKELGTNCWLVRRFIQDGDRCPRVWVCNYPEKKTCQAVKAEIHHLMGEQERLIIIHHNIEQRIIELQNTLKN